MRIEEGLAAISAAGIWIDANVGEDWLVVDLRAADVYRREHIPGSLNVPWPELGDHELRLKVYAAGRPIACVAPRDRDAPGVQARLHAMGFGRARVLEGGVEAWSAMGFPLESSAAPDGCEARVTLLAGGLIVSGLVMGALVSPGFLMVSGLGWAVCGSRSTPRPRPEPGPGSVAPVAPVDPPLAFSR